MMKKEKDLLNPFDQFYDAAYPLTITSIDGNVSYAVKGLSKRELFATMAMQGLLTTNKFVVYKEVAERAVKCADALLEELNKGNDERHE